MYKLTSTVIISYPYFKTTYYNVRRKLQMYHFKPNSIFKSQYHISLADTISWFMCYQDEKYGTYLLKLNFLE